jgi:hypothetical protein
MEVFRFIPLGPVILFCEFASGEFHNFCHVSDVTISYDVPSWSPGKIGSGVRFWGPTIAELVDAQL